MFKEFSPLSSTVALRTRLRLRARRVASRALLIEAGVLRSLSRGRSSIGSKALLTARAVGARISALAVVAEPAVAGASVSLRLVEAAGRITLCLTGEILGAVLRLVEVSAGTVL